ncbi:MAG: hypothetical protein GXP32_03510 [Kiritimatiellaeota bacterium]|nr:hypothetical protein [Kiritimatiellota bacterium]
MKTMVSTKNMNSLEKMKSRRKTALVVTVCVLVSLLLYGVLRPDPEEREISRIKGMILDRKPGRMSQEDRDSIRKLMEKLSPETRQRLATEVMRGMLDQFRKKTAGLTMEEKRKKVDEAVRKMRARFVKMSDERRDKLLERMDSPEATKRMKTALGFYYSDFSPEERKLMDPVVQEWSIEMSVLQKRARKR